jgi:hypothetical protein
MENDWETRVGALSALLEQKGYDKNNYGEVDMPTGTLADWMKIHQAGTSVPHLFPVEVCQVVREYKNKGGHILCSFQIDQDRLAGLAVREVKVERFSDTHRLQEHRTVAVDCPADIPTRGHASRMVVAKLPKKKMVRR